MSHDQAFGSGLIIFALALFIVLAAWDGIRQRRGRS